MIVKTRTPGFFYEFKKNRTTMLKEREPPIPEPFYRRFIRERAVAKAREDQSRLENEKK
jgi:hypothetical protein